MENRKGSGIFLGVIGVATLIVAIIGATFAYFTATANSAENAIETTSTSLTLNYVDTVNTKLSTSLIPATETIATYGAMNQTYISDPAKICVDDNGNDICSIYEFTITNPNTTTNQNISVDLNVVTNTFTNLKYKIYEGSIKPADGSSAPTLDEATSPSPVVATGLLGNTGSKKNLSELTQVLDKSSSVTYTMLIWIDETTNEQNADAGKSFSAGITVTSGDGSGVTGTIAGAN